MDTIFDLKFALFSWVPYLIKFSTCLPEVQCLNTSSSFSQLRNRTQSLPADDKKDKTSSGEPNWRGKRGSLEQPTT